MFNSIGAKIVMAMVCASPIGGATALNSNVSLAHRDRVYSRLLSQDVAGALIAADLTAQSQLLTGLTYRLVTEFKPNDLDLTRKEIRDLHGVSDDAANPHEGYGYGTGGLSCMNSCALDHINTD